MKPSLAAGLTRVQHVAVDRDRTISFMGEEGRVYSTPNLVRDIEHTCRDLILEHADPGEDSVGVDVALRHLAPIAAISGEVEIAFSGIAGATGFVQSGRLRALGVSSLKPVAALPGVPPIAEVLPGYEFTAWFVVAAPKGTQREIIATLNEHFVKAMNAPETVKRLAADGIDVIGSSPEQASATLESELKKWATVIRERGMKAE